MDKHQYCYGSAVKALVLSLTAMLSTPALAADIKPGLWQITQSMDSEQLPEQLKREKTLAQCVSAEDAADMTLAMRKRWQQLDCTEMSIERDGDAIVTSAQCQRGERLLSLSGKVTIHDSTHYSSTMQTSGDATLTTYQEARWLSAECPNSE